MKGTRGETNVFTWESDANGDARSSIPFRMRGVLDRIVTRPSASAAPTDNYDITIVTASGEDVLQGVGANRDTANVETAYVYRASTTGDAERQVCPPVDLWFVVANAGANKAGSACVYLRY